MKKVFLVSLILVPFIYSACNETSAEKTGKHKNGGNVDTAWTRARYIVGYKDGKALTDEDRCFRFVKDTAIADSNGKVNWERDTIYFVPLTDTLRNANKLPVLDSVTHAPKMQTVYATLQKKFVLIDYRKNL